MRQRVRNLIKQNRKLYKIFMIIKFILSPKFLKIDGSKKKYPKVIQLPITYNCNSKCVMCNVWKMDSSNEMTLEDFSKFMKDDIFKEVESVGINGGEPSLVPNLNLYINEVLELPKLKNINIISHGFSQKPLLKNLELIYNECKKRNIFFSVLISLDGVGEIHDAVRGKENVFEKTFSTIEKINNDKSKYCDYMSLRCTIVKQNIHNLVELETFIKKYKIDLEFGLAIDNKRIESNLLTAQFSIIDKDFIQTAKEFIHSRFQKSFSINDKFKYFAIFYWLEAKKKKRLLGCSWKDRDITLDSRGEIYYCAVESNRLGNLNERKGEEIFFDKKNIKYRQKIIENNCDNCIHDYDGDKEISSIGIFLKDFLFQRFWLRIYRFKIFIMDLGIVR